MITSIRFERFVQFTGFVGRMQGKPVYMNITFYIYYCAYSSRYPRANEPVAIPTAERMDRSLER